MNSQVVVRPTGGRESAVGSEERSWLARYAAVLVVGFTILYLFTRSSLPIGDRIAFIRAAREGNPATLLYGNPSHFLQVPMSRGIWLVSTAIGVPLSFECIFVTLALVGTLAAIVFSGLIAARMAGTRAAAWLAAILFGTSLQVWTQVNGEQYGLALGFVTAGLWFALRGRSVLAAIFWSLAIISHSEFVMAGAAFLMALWMTRPRPMSIGAKLRSAAVLVGLAASLTLLILLFWSLVIGKWTTPASLVTWVRHIYYIGHLYAEERPEVFRAMKGLVTALTVAGHFWRDILTGRGAFGNPVFVLESGVGLFVLVLTGVFLIAAASQRRLFLFGLAWLLPFHVLGNWWFQPTVEKYHAGALPGFVLLVTGGLVTIAERLGPRRRYLLYGLYVSACAGLNLFGALLPMQALGRDTATAEREIRRVADEREGRAVFIACDAPRAIVGAGVPFLRLRSVWKGTVPEIQQTLTTWTSDRLREGKEPYLVGRWCLPEEWKTTWSKEPFDLFFLEQSFKLVSTGIAGIPISDSVPTNPFNWTRGDIIRLESNE